ncbi:MAG TPA: 6-carboxytetrahydropterin synthase [Methanomicrobiales archaeon]|nr:6-carboxytetrahydropterin synthase [Methanomicrobiales archaeon]
METSKGGGPRESAKGRSPSGNQQAEGLVVRQQGEALMGTSKGGGPREKQQGEALMGTSKGRSPRENQRGEAPVVTVIYKEVCFDASHRLLHYEGKCKNLHGHRWRVEVWIAGEIDPETGILVDFNVIRDVIERFDHQVILNRDDPMVACLEKFQPVVKTRGDPSSEVLAGEIRRLLEREFGSGKSRAWVLRIRVWESDTCCAEQEYEGQ